MREVDGAEAPSEEDMTEEETIEQLPFIVGPAPGFTVVTRNKTVLCTCDKQTEKDTDDDVRRRARIVCRALNAYVLWETPRPEIVQ